MTTRPASTDGERGAERGHDGLARERVLHALRKGGVGGRERFHRRDAASGDAGQQPLAALLVLADLGQHHADVVLLLLELLAVALQHRHEGLQLRRGVGLAVVHPYQLQDLRQRQAEALAAQRELEPRAVALRVDAVAAGACRFEQPGVFVKADRARGDVELGGQFGDREAAAGVHR